MQKCLGIDQNRTDPFLTTVRSYCNIRLFCDRKEVASQKLLYALHVTIS